MAKVTVEAELKEEKNISSEIQKLKKIITSKEEEIENLKNKIVSYEEELKESENKIRGLVQNHEGL